ncbi:hypothetical protein T01_7757 [Trichinella spiralis]|uniref:Uncharacterized protein n=1 Tax=Trichinella spiralis TaxID=6334 RepID=A0A0V1B6M0_TRISP|nr:hypothetical protein T01_7757 [Trichinella spiralis]
MVQKRKRNSGQSGTFLLEPVFNGGLCILPRVDCIHIVRQFLSLFTISCCALIIKATHSPLFHNNREVDRLEFGRFIRLVIVGLEGKRSLSFSSENVILGEEGRIVEGVAQFRGPTGKEDFQFYS